MSRKVCQREAPSILAASKTSCGMACRPARSMTMMKGIEYQASIAMMPTNAGNGWS